MRVKKKQLEEIVGKQNVLHDSRELAGYCRDQSFVQPRTPDFVVFVETVEEIQGVVALANNGAVPVIPYSSGLNLHGATIPDHGGIVLNMSRMNKILTIDEENLFVIVEPGVTYGDLQDALTKKGLRIMVPLGVPAGRSVLTSYLERDVLLAAPSFEHGNALIMDTEIVLPTGELFRTGNWVAGGSPGNPNGPVRSMLQRLWTGAQGTLGIVTKMVLAVELLPRERRVFFMPFDSLAAATAAMVRVQYKEIGMECLLLNRFNLAALFNDVWEVPGEFPAAPRPAAAFERLRSRLPDWVVVLCLNGPPRHPEEKIAYEAKTLTEVCDMMNVGLQHTVVALPGAQTLMLAEMLRPWGMLKKFNYRGWVHDVSFKAPVESVPDLERLLYGLAQRYGYPEPDVGGAMIPLERGRGMHCEFDFHCNHDDEKETDRVHELWLAVSAELMNHGAYFDRPYGAWAEMVYNRAGGYTEKLKQIKKELDPNNIMNPGKLCFS